MIIIIIIMPSLPPPVHLVRQARMDHIVACFTLDSHMSELGMCRGRRDATVFRSFVARFVACSLVSIIFLNLF